MTNRNTIYFSPHSILLAVVACFGACNGQYSIGSGDERASDDGAPDSSSPLADEARPRLLLEAIEDNGPAVTIDFAKGVDKDGPRVAEIIVKHSSNLVYTGVVEGAAIAAAGKQLIAQKKSAREVRLIVLAQNVNALSSGRLATLRFKRLNNDRARVKIETDKPIFAPSESGEGLLVGNPVEF